MSVQEKFRRVAGQRLVRVSAEVLALESGEDIEERLAGLLRDVHTLKGEAGVLGLRPVSQLSHALEELLTRLQSRSLEITPEAVDLTLHALDVLAQLVEGREVPLEALEGLISDMGGPIGGAGSSARAEPDRRGEDPQEPPSLAAPRESPSSAMAQPTRESATLRRLHVDPARLGKLSEVAGDLLVLAERSAARSRELAELSRRIRREFADGLPPEWGETLEALARAYREDTFLNSQRIQELSEQLRVLRLSPLTSLLEGYRRAVRDLARSLGKDARLVVTAEAVEVDQSVLEVISEPLLHLVRNAIAHGLELPEERVSAGKPPQGTIRIGVSQNGSHVEIVLEDDGRGINPQEVAAVAERRGILTPEEAAALTQAAAHELLFRPGFSTSSLDQVSGRGVGLDVVRVSVEEHQGALEVESEVGRGTRFTLRLPMNIAMGEALVCVASESHFAIAADQVRGVARLEEDSLCVLGHGQGYRREGSVIPFRSLGQLISADREPRPGDPVVLVASRGGDYALGVDAILGQRTVMFRPLDPFLAELPFVQASCVLADGSIALLLTPTTLVHARRDCPVSSVASSTASSASKRVLVVEDSPVSRDLVMEIVRSAGYPVAGAEDGLLALELLSTFRPDLVLTDLEMPRLDGLELTRRMRRQGLTTPVVVITTRASDGERRDCMEAGADAFIDKSRFREVALLDTIRRLIG